jgi:hypothetical protein
MQRGGRIGLTGTINNMATQNGFPDNVATMLQHIDELGSPLHENHFSVGWAWAVDTPLQWTKQVASRLRQAQCYFPAPAEAPAYRTPLG